MILSIIFRENVRARGVRENVQEPQAQDEANVHQYRGHDYRCLCLPFPFLLNLSNLFHLFLT